MALPPRRRLLLETTAGRSTSLPDTVRNLEHDADEFQRMLNESRIKRLPRSNEELIAEVERILPDPSEHLPESPALQGDMPDHSEDLIELEQIMSERYGPDKPEPEPPTPNEIVSTALASIEQCAMTMVEEGRRAATAVSLISQLIKADSEKFASEAFKLNSKYCSRVSDYLKECQDIEAGFKQQKELMIKRVQALGPLVKSE